MLDSSCLAHKNWDVLDVKIISRNLLNKLINGGQYIFY